MKPFIISLIFICAPAFAQIGGSTASHIRWGSSLPASCRPGTGDVFFKTSATVGPYYCSATNTWTAITGGGGGGGTPGSPVNSLQYNDASAFAGVSGSVVRSTGQIEVGSGLGSVYGGFGLIQNLLINSECFDCTGWDDTDVTVASATPVAPNGDTVFDNDLESTVNGAFVSQEVTALGAIGTRTFSLSVWLKVPTTPVTSLLSIVSSTPTTCGTQTASVTTSWQRFSLTCTFGADTATAITARITPVNGGQGLVYAWGAQMEEATGPNGYAISTPSIYCATEDYALRIRSANACFAVNGSGGGKRIPFVPGLAPSSLVFVDSGGYLTANSYVVPGVITTLTGTDIVFGSDPPVVPNRTFVIRAGSAQSTALTTWIDSTGTQQALVTSTGVFENAQCTAADLGTKIANAGGQCYCSDCKVTTVVANVVSDATCTGSGGGALAINIGGTAKCMYLP